uniref:Uncharacterized protein n=1 Tax=Trichuris muris TaxID=70415 RepID=A0A5S6QSY5_TRIMR
MRTSKRSYPILCVLSYWIRLNKVRLRFSARLRAFCLGFWREASGALVRLSAESVAVRQRPVTVGFLPFSAPFAQLPTGRINGHALGRRRSGDEFFLVESTFLPFRTGMQVRATRLPFLFRVFFQIVTARHRSRGVAHRKQLPCGDLFCPSTRAAGKTQETFVWALLALPFPLGTLAGRSRRRGHLSGRPQSRALLKSILRDLFNPVSAGQYASVSVFRLRFAKCATSPKPCRFPRGVATVEAPRGEGFSFSATLPFRPSLSTLSWVAEVEGIAVDPHLDKAKAKLPALAVQLQRAKHRLLGAILRRISRQEGIARMGPDKFFRKPARSVSRVRPILLDSISARLSLRHSASQSSWAVVRQFRPAAAVRDVHWENREKSLWPHPRGFRADAVPVQ